MQANQSFRQSMLFIVTIQLLITWPSAAIACEIATNREISQYNMSQSPDDTLPRKVRPASKGYFHFKNEPLNHILFTVERLYGIKVIYLENVENKYYTIGKISRTEPVSKILRLLELMGAIRWTCKDGKEVHIRKCPQ